MKSLDSKPNHLTTNSQEDGRRTTFTSEEDEVRELVESVAVPSNTATNNSINEENNIETSEDFKIKFLRFGVDSLYLSYQGVLFDHIDQKLNLLKQQARSDNPEQQAKAQIKIGDHLFEVKDKGTSMFSYVLVDNAFRIQLSRPLKMVPMAYIKISSEYLTYKTPEQAEAYIYDLLKQLGSIQSSANVSRVDLYVDFVSKQNMEAWTREAWITRAGSVNTYSIKGQFTGWAIGLGGAIAARLYDKLYELQTSNKTYLLNLWQMAGRLEGEPVWRLEFEMKRDFLKQKELVPLTSVLENLNGLWSYATTEWLRLTIPNPDDQTRARWPIHPLWVALAGIDWETNDSPLKSRFDNRRIPNEEAILNRGFSAFTSYMAANGWEDHDLAFQTYFDVLAFHIGELARRFDTPIDEYIQRKVALKARSFNTVNNNPQEEYDDFKSSAYRKASDGE
jgi:hypothetical protein